MWASAGAFTLRLLPRNFIAWTAIVFLFMQVVVLYSLAGKSILPFGWNVPKVPFISCGPEAGGATVEAAPHTASDVSYVAGAGLRDLVTEAVPSAEDVKETLVGMARWAGHVYGSFMAGTDGEPPPVDEEPKVHKKLPISGGGCAPCPGADPDVLLAAQAARAAGFTGRDLVTAVAVAGAESGYRPAAANAHSSARGLFQIMQSVHKDKLVGQWSDPYDSATVARKVWKAAGQSWSPWVAYTSGAYRSHLGEAQQVAGCVSGAALLAGDGARTALDGVTVNVRTARMLTAAGRAMGQRPRITQGSYTTAVAASGGTHAGGGVVDLQPPVGFGYDATVAALVNAGFAAWHRTPSQGPWPEHIHAVAIGDPGLSGSARAQVSAWQRGEDGLGGTPGL